MQSGQRSRPVMAVGDDPQDHVRPHDATHRGTLDDVDPRTLRKSQVQQLRTIGCIGCGQPCLDGVPRGRRGLGVLTFCQIDGQQFLGQ